MTKTRLSIGAAILSLTLLAFWASVAETTPIVQYSSVVIRPGDPSAGDGFQAGVGTLYSRRDVTQVWVKNGAAATAWTGLAVGSTANLRYLGSQFPAGTYTPTTGATAARLREVGGGGGGGGGQAGQLAYGAGGAAGAYCEIWINPGVQLTGGAVNIGAAGAGGANTGGAGGNGGDTTTVIQGTTYTAKGGLGGAGMLAGGTSLNSVGGKRQAGTSACDVKMQAEGQDGHRIGNAGTAIGGATGDGASSPWGGGGKGDNTAGAPGDAGDGKGAGGGGATGAGGGQAGGAGTAGFVIIDEFAP